MPMVGGAEMAPLYQVAQTMVQKTSGVAGTDLALR